MKGSRGVRSVRHVGHIHRNPSPSPLHPSFSTLFARVPSLTSVAIAVTPPRRPLPLPSSIVVLPPRFESTTQSILHMDLSSHTDVSDMDSKMFEALSAMLGMNLESLARKKHNTKQKAQAAAPLASVHAMLIPALARPAAQRRNR